MRSFPARLVVYLFSLVLFGSSAQACGMESTYSVRALGCEIPVPTAYVLDATYKRSIVLIHKEGRGQIQIGEFTGVPERFRIVSERTAGRLVVAEIEVTTEGRVPDSMIVIRDQENSVSLIGAARDLERPVLDACVEGAK